MKKSVLASALVIAFAAMASPAFAAEDGTLGATSSGTIGVSGRIEAPPPRQVRVSGLNDIDLGVIQAGLGLGDRMCLYHTSPTFSLTVDQVGGGAFRLIGPNGVAAPIIVDLILPARSERMAPGALVSGLVANTESETCETGPTALIGAAVTFDLPADAPVGVYNATLSIVMAAE